MIEGLVAWVRHLRRIQPFEGFVDTTQQLAHPGEEIQRTRRGLRRLWDIAQELNSHVGVNRHSRPS